MSDIQPFFIKPERTDQEENVEITQPDTQREKTLGQHAQVVRDLLNLHL